MVAIAQDLLQPDPGDAQRNDNEEPREVGLIREAAAHLAEVDGDSREISIHSASSALLAWALANGGERVDFPERTEPFSAAFWRVRIGVAGVSIVLFARDS